MFLTADAPEQTTAVVDRPARETTRTDGATTSSRLPQLDFLRAIAVLLVLGTHPAVKFENIGPCLPLATAWHHVGWTGVNLFFVLSGFLIGGLLFAEIRATGALDVRRFVVRRAFKIWPAYYIYLLILLVMFVKVGAPLSQLFPFFVHVQNYCGNIDAIAPHTWSLAVEEHFYLALPLFLSFMMRWQAYHMLVCFLVLAILCGWLRFNGGGDFPEILTHLCIDSLAFGVLLAFVFHYHRPLFDRIARQRLLLGAGGLAVVGLAAAPGRQPGPWGCALIPVGLYLGYGAILLAMLSTPLSSFRKWPLRVLALVGFYSYSIYLLHVDVAYRLVYSLDHTAWAQDIAGWIRWPAGMTLYVLLAIATGILMSRCIEMPALALRDRFFPRKSDAIGGSPQSSARASKEPALCCGRS